MIIFFEELNDLDNYPMSNLKIDEILKNNENYIGKFSKDNVPILKNNESTIVNLDKHKFICNIYRVQSMDSNQCARFCILFVRGNIKNENDYNNFYCNLKKIIF